MHRKRPGLGGLVKEPGGGEERLLVLSAQRDPSGQVGLLALALSAVGVYGVTASVISARTHEIGIRIALGAPRGSVLGMPFRRGMLTACAGLAAGLLPAYDKMATQS